MRRRNFLKLVGVACVAPALPEYNVLKEPLNCSCGCGAIRGQGNCYTSRFYRNEFIPTMKSRQSPFYEQLKDTAEWGPAHGFEGELGYVGGVRWITTK